MVPVTKEGNWQLRLTNATSVVHSLFDNNATLQHTCDASFDVMKEKDSEDSDVFHVHRVFVAARSAVFEAMFYGPAAETKMPIQVNDITANTFRAMLRWIYKDDVSNLKTAEILDLMYAAHKYDIRLLLEQCVKLASDGLSADMLFPVLKQATLLDVKSLVDVCYTFVDKHTAVVLDSKTFLE